MDQIIQAQKSLTDKVVQELRENDGCLPEACETINNASRRVVATMRAAKGQAWLGKVNLYGDDRGRRDKILWEWDGGIVYNFSACFVLPAFDEKLVDMIHQRDISPYTGTADDAVKIDAIFDRVQQLGGVLLHWT